MRLKEIPMAMTSYTDIQYRTPARGARSRTHHVGDAVDGVTARQFACKCSDDEDGVQQTRLDDNANDLSQPSTGKR